MQMAGTRTHNLLKKIVVAIFLGICVALFCIQDDEWFKTNIGSSFINTFSQSLECHMVGTATRVNIFTGTLELENVCVNPIKGNGWRWSAGTMKVQFAWLSLLLYGSIDLHVFLQHLNIYSDASSDGPALMDHINKFSGAPSTLLPLFLRSLTVCDGKISVKHEQQKVDATLHFSSETKKINDVMRSSIYCKDGLLSVGDMQIFNSLNGTLYVDIAQRLGLVEPVVRADCSLLLPRMQKTDQICFITGSWEKSAGNFVLKNSNRTLLFDPFKIYQENNQYYAECDAHIPLSYILNLYKPDNTFSYTADCKIKAKVDLQNPLESAHGHIEIDSVQYEKMPIDVRAQLSVTRKEGQWKGGVTVCPHKQHFAGSWFWQDSTASGGIELTNSAALVLPETVYWLFPAHAVKLNVGFNSNADVQGSYKARAQHSKLETAIDCSGTIKATPASCTIDGGLADDTYHMTFDVDPFLHLKKLIYKDAQRNLLLDISSRADDTKKVAGTVDFTAIKSLFKNIFDVDLQGEGKIRVTGSVQTSAIVLDGSLENGTVRLPGTYNFMNGLDAHCIADLQNKKVVVENLRCSLHQGSIKAQRGVLLFDDTFNITFAHMPCVFENCLINRHKDLFATISGRLLMTKRKEQNTVLKGTIFIDRAQLNKNIFSQEFRRGLQQSPTYLFDTAKRSIDCDIALITKEAVRIKTGFLETRAQGNITLKNDIRNPEIAGHITLNSGSLAFPYKELLITKGDIYFLPQQPYDPLIELVAKNKIKKYTVALHITGSAQNPYTLLEASPALTEEQIVSLLLVGSEDESLNIVVPALLMQNVKNILVSSDQTAPAVNSYFNALLKPFKNIRLVPRLNDQTGRGGLRAALEMDVGERWRVMMQKNFSLPEDTRFELEYLLSDEISLKGVRDERGDVRGEVEMRWKFGR